MIGSSTKGWSAFAFPVWGSHIYEVLLLFAFFQRKQRKPPAFPHFCWSCRGGGRARKQHWSLGPSVWPHLHTITHTFLFSHVFRTRNAVLLGYRWLDEAPIPFWDGWWRWQRRSCGPEQPYPGPEESQSWVEVTEAGLHFLTGCWSPHTHRAGGQAWQETRHSGQLSLSSSPRVSMGLWEAKFVQRILAIAFLEILLSGIMSFW